MATSSSRSSSNTKSQTNQKSQSITAGQTNGGSNTNSSSYGGGSSESYGGSHSETSTEGWSKSHTSGYSWGEAQSQSSGKSWLSGEIEGQTKAQRDQLHNGNYEQSDQVNQTYQRLQNALNNKPGDFTSKYQPTIDNLYNQLINRGKFSYDFNVDPMYRMYRDQYTTQGKQAMENAIGRASQMTGGYGNSYAQTAGQQIYQQYLQNLNDAIPTLRDQAYQEWKAEADDMKDRLNLANTMYQNEYGQYRDKLSDYRDERDYSTNLYNSERAFDYNRWNNDRNYWNDEFWKERSAEQSNAAASHSSNWQRTESDTTTQYGEHSVTDSSNWSTANSSNWNNSSSATTNWQTNLQNTIAQMQQLQQSMTNSMSNSWSSGSGSGSGSKQNGFDYTFDKSGKITGDAKDNGNTSWVKLTEATNNKTNLNWLKNYLKNTADGPSAQKKLEGLQDGNVYDYNSKSSDESKKWIPVKNAQFDHMSDEDISYVLYLLKNQW